MTIFHVAILCNIAITMFCGTNNFPHNIPLCSYNQTECRNFQENSMKYCQSNKTWCWIWRMLCINYQIKNENSSTHIAFGFARYLMECKYFMTHEVCVYIYIYINYGFRFLWSSVWIFFYQVTISMDDKINSNLKWRVTILEVNP